MNRILYIDDNQDHLLIVQQMLLRKSYECETEKDWKKAMDRLTQDDFDLILLDIQMPGITGKELLQQFRQDPKIKEIPVIAITADGTAFSGQNPYDFGFNGYLSKPIMPTELYRLVGELINVPAE